MDDRAGSGGDFLGWRAARTGEPQPAPDGTNSTHSANSSRTQAGQGRRVGTLGTQHQRCVEDRPPGRLGMLGGAVNNWGQGTLDLDQVGSGLWAVDPSRLQVSYAAGAWL